MEKICVAVRVRPFVSEESFNGAFWKVEDNRVSLHRPHGTPVPGVSYAFDHVFDESCSNATVYERLTKDIIHAAVEGFNGTAFAYGQTSSGKTFTMNGSDADPGIICLAIRDVFNKIQMTSDREFLIRVSYMEIYNEEINDLFAVENQKLQIHESLERGVFVSGLREEIVNDADEVLKLIESGEVNRHFGETNMNARSSRSHTIFRMVIESKEKDSALDGEKSTSDAIRVSILNLVDLAGSERIAKTGADGVRLKEGKHINKSLMVLGNVINKLSEGVKQRVHIPFRDSKLTRILQPALGGNAKTSIICTMAPEEVHIEETKGTLQFASRAKRITNYAHVNEILTDAALLKRQKLEIEDLRKKLEGSHAELLEKEIRKLRNEMLKYEVEREKLEMELEEERKLQKERDNCIKEKQMKIENLSSLANFSDSDRNSSQGQEVSEGSFKKHFTDSKSIRKRDVFETPCYKAADSNCFVARRSNYSKLECSPLPDTLSTVADEETWFEMNKGYNVDLDSLQMTPARKVQSFPSSDMTPGCKDGDYERELQDLKKKLELAVEEKNEIERQNAEHVLLNQKLKQEISDLQQEAKFSGELPVTLSQCVSSCKEVYADVLSSMQSSISNGNSSACMLLSTLSDISTVVFSTLETHFAMLMEDKRLRAGKNSPQEHFKTLRETLSNAVAPLTSRTSSIQNEHANLQCCENKDCALGGELAIYEGNLIAGFNSIKEKFHALQKELDESNQLLQVSKGKFSSLQKQFQVLKEERNSLLQKVSESTQRVHLVTDQKENALRDLNAELQKRRYLEEEIKQISVAFAGRQKSLISFHNEFRTKLEKLKSESSVSTPKSLGH